MLRNRQRSIIFLINNGGYTIEVKIHDGPYNVIKNWNYTGLVDAIHNGEGKCWTTKVHCEEELMEAIEVAEGEKKECLCFIEVIVHKDDTARSCFNGGLRLLQPIAAHQALISKLTYRSSTASTECY
ncbi:pyruvate decarboxylase 2-like [Prunus yedoensis var. nudiflora]|uniref:pyruvate decarboxylase n=1 Tax=Prunus yedoensis var. nudiflora TaxID=2094558 RepID=A0A314Z1U0_PRUYE|nr:pyruvate decarboxylase 2-like [Prunus yedoensis var. nudiflora]